MNVRTLLALLLVLIGTRAASAPAPGDIWSLDIHGAIGPAVADYMVRGLQEAQDRGASVVVLQIDTPGGLDTSMRQMIQAILASRIPVVGYVSPQGARAASAGTYILYACHVAAMAPATNLGAATPVQISPSLGKEEHSQPETAMERKIINDATAYIESLAQLRGRNAEWAKQAVTEGVSLSAAEARKLNVIDLVADDMNDLLAQLDGREVTIGHDRSTLHTRDTGVYQLPVDWRSEFLSVITNPNVAYILVLVGIYGLIFEFSHPGVGVPGIAGAVCLLLALYAFQVLPISYTGLGLILLGLGLMTAEAFAPSFGILGLGGITAFVIGSIVLMDTSVPGYQIAMPLILGFAVFSALLLVFALGLVLKARRHAVVSGLQPLLGQTATIESVRNGEAYIRLQGERWHVECPDPLAVDDTVTVTDASGVILKVAKTSTGGRQQ